MSVNVAVRWFLCLQSKPSPKDFGLVWGGGLRRLCTALSGLALGGEGLLVEKGVGILTDLVQSLWPLVAVPGGPAVLNGGEGQIRGVEGRRRERRQWENLSYFGKK